MKTRFVVPLALFWCLFLTIFGRAQPIFCEVTGAFISAQSLFRGEVTYRLPVNYGRAVVFHLPPNWFSESDRRENYQFESENGDIYWIDRDSVKGLTAFRVNNVQLPKSIRITSVFINTLPTPFRYRNNPSLPPGLNSRESLLEVEIPMDGHSGKTTVQIAFETRVHPFSDSHPPLLWDYLPRPVMIINGKPRLNDRIKPTLQIKTDIRLINNSSGLSNDRIQREESVSVPLLILGKWKEKHDLFDLTFGTRVDTKREYYVRRIKRTLLFLLGEKWIDQTGLYRYKFVIWNGPLKVTGSYILLPESLLRYHNVFHKLHEIAILKGIIESTIRSRYLLDDNRYPWILPAIQSIIIRDFFNYWYEGDSSYFPWSDWMNLNYYQEKTVIPWLKSINEKDRISARASLDSRYHLKAYHPWFEKGFHLFTTLFNDQSVLRTNVVPKIRQLMTGTSSRSTVLDKRKFFQLFFADKISSQKAEEWLSQSGTVDYGIKNVKTRRHKTGKEIEFEITSGGSITPDLDVRLFFKKKEAKTIEINDGPGNYKYIFPESVTKIQLNPTYTLLEESYLNNNWNDSYKLRPIWDFPTANRWLFTVSPLVGGNTFDNNLFGLSLTLSYLDRAEFVLESWKAANKDRALWVGKIGYYGFPFKKNKITYKSSQLSEKELNAFIFKHLFEGKEKEFWIQLELNSDRIGKRITPTGEEIHEIWNSGYLSARFPVYESAFFTYEAGPKIGRGENVTLKGETYRQRGISQDVIWRVEDKRVYFRSSHFDSTGIVPPQYKYSMGGPKGLPGFPRDAKLLFENRIVYTAGSSVTGLFTHLNWNLLELIWLYNVTSSINLHYGRGSKSESAFYEEFKDVEIQFAVDVEMVNKYVVNGVFSIAKPIGHERYKATRIILFSNWVF